jgi:ATP-dependent Lon protease
MMLQSVLETDRRFGIVRWDPNQQTMAAVGCCAEVIQHQTGDDGRSNIVTLGQQRFRVLNVTRETPFRSAMVSWIEDEPVDNTSELESLAATVTQALKDVVELTGKLTDSKSTLPDDLPDLPRELSFWIGAHLGGPVADQQQDLLELTSTRTRLEQEFEMLDETRRQLAARTVLRDTLSETDPSNG